MSDLYLKQFVLGPMENFVYLIGSKSKRECVVVDPAWDIDAIEAAAQADDMKIVGGLVTHYHPDHCGGHLWGHDIAGAAEFVDRFGCKIHVNREECDGIKMVTGLSDSDLQLCDSGEKIAVGNIDVTAIHTPGHTPGSQCFLVDQSLVAGDTLFISGCGRVDLPGGNADQLYESLTQKLGKLPKNTILYPGHNYDSEAHATLERVADKNPYFSAQNSAAFRAMMGG